MVDRDELGHSLPGNTPHTTRAVAEERESELGRLIALSDGVFAFAMTLLVISIEIPDLTEIQARKLLITDVGQLWPQMLSYVIGFFVIGFVWASHRRLYARVRDFDDRLARYNILLLMLVAFLPFPTGILGVYGNLAFPAIFFALVLTALSLVFILTLDHLDRHRELLTRDGEGFDFPRAKARHLVSAMIFLSSIPVAWLLPGAGQLVWVLLAFNHRITEKLLPYLPGRFQERRRS